MKKIVTLFVLFFAFVATSNAQTKKSVVKPTPEAIAKEELYELSKVVDLNKKSDAFVNLNALFTKKHTELNAPNVTEEQKQQIYAMVESKLRAYFTPDEFKQIESTQGLLDNLIH